MYNRPDDRYPENWNKIRFDIFAEYNYKCAKCQSYSKGNLHLHHIIPLSRGGSNDKSNLIPLCSSCHRNIHFYNDGRI